MTIFMPYKINRKEDRTLREIRPIIKRGLCFFMELPE
jgi:hypothetical protein